MILRHYLSLLEYAGPEWSDLGIVEMDEPEADLDFGQVSKSQFQALLSFSSCSPETSGHLWL